MRMEKVSYIDQSWIYVLKEAVNTLQEHNILLLITGMQTQPTDMLKKVQMIPYLIAEENLYLDFQSAIKALSCDNISYYYPKYIAIEA